MATGTPMIRSWTVLLGACVLVLAGCGRFSSGERAPEQRSVGVPVLETVPEAFGGTDELGGTATPVAPAPPPTPADGEPPAPPASPIAPPQPVGPVNVAAGVTDGVRIEVVAEDGPVYPSRPRFRIQVTMENVSDQGQFHQVGQGDYAVIRDAAGTEVWRSSACNPTMDIEEPDGGAQEIMPGEEVTVIVPYPQPDMPNDRGCDLPDGSYTLHGVFPMCPRKHVQETGNPGTYRCLEGQEREYTSTGLQLTIG